MNLTHWNTARDFTIHEIASLIAGIDPLATSPAPSNDADSKRKLATKQLLEDHCEEVSRLIDAFTWHSDPPEEGLYSLDEISSQTNAHTGIWSQGYNFARREILRGGPLSAVVTTGDVEEYCFPTETQLFSREEVIRWIAMRKWQSAFSFGSGENGVNASTSSTATPPASERLTETSNPDPQLATPRLTNNQDALIAAMAHKHYKFEPNDARSDVPKKLAALLEQYEYRLDAQTIRGYLKNGIARLKPPT